MTYKHVENTEDKLEELDDHELQLVSHAYCLVVPDTGPKFSATGATAVLGRAAVLPAHTLRSPGPFPCICDPLKYFWVQAESLWMHTSRYNDTQELGSLARQAGHVAWIRYKSVRAPGHTCGAVFDPNALRMVTPEMQYEHWYCRASKDRITFSNGRKRFDF